MTDARHSDDGGTTATPAARWRGALRRHVGAAPQRHALWQVAIGVFAGLIAAALRLALPLDPMQLPTITVVIALAVVTTYVGIRAGIACAVVGGLFAWYRFFTPYSWSIAQGGWPILIGFGVIATVIITTAHLYRTSEQRAHARREAELAARAETAALFARELAHRLKNALTIVQAIALQTLDGAAPATQAFTSRLRALATANDLLSEHVSDPVAELDKVIAAVLGPFEADRFHIAVERRVLPAQQVVSLSLALHELATNATKYGALSVPAGRVRLATETDGATMRLVWHERGGPSVTTPRTTGFGTRLLRRSGMNAAIDYDPDGVRCVLELAHS